MTGVGLRDGRQHRDRASLFDNLIAERDAFRIVLLEPLIGKVWRGEYLEVRWSTSPTSLVVSTQIQTVVIGPSLACTGPNGYLCVMD